MRAREAEMSWVMKGLFPFEAINADTPTFQSPCIAVSLAEVISVDLAMAQFDHYATSAEFSDYRRPVLKEVTVPESIKRRLPSKHYVSLFVYLFSSCSYLAIALW